MAKLRIFAEGCVAIALRMKLKWLVCKPRETKVRPTDDLEVAANSSGRASLPASREDRLDDQGPDSFEHEREDETGR